MMNMYYLVLVTLFSATLLHHCEALAENDCDNTLPVDQTTIRLLCTRNILQQGIHVQKHPHDRNQFIVCTDIMFGCMGRCPPNKHFESNNQDCNDNPAEHCNPPPSAQRKTESLKITSSCDKSSTVCDYLPYPGDNTSFIICDRTYQPKKGKCLPNTVFNPKLKACTNNRIVACKSNKKHCKRKVLLRKYPAREFYFGCIDDPIKFIQCDMFGNEFIMTCHNNTVWCDDILTCCIPGNLPIPA